MQTDITHSQRRAAAVLASRLASGVKRTGGTGSNAAIVDHGFMCSTAPTINTASIPTDGAQVPTGLAASPTPLAATSCAVVSVGGVNQAQVTAHVTVAHGVTPGLTYTMQGFNGGSAPGFTGYNGTYTAPLRDIRNYARWNHRRDKLPVHATRYIGPRGNRAQRDGRHNYTPRCGGG